jgi:hypothetical protein
MYTFGILTSFFNSVSGGPGLNSIGNDGCESGTYDVNPVDIDE